MSHEHFWSEMDDDGVRECLWCGCKAKDSVDIGITPPEPPRPEGFKPGDLVMVTWTCEGLLPPGQAYFRQGDVAKLIGQGRADHWDADFNDQGNARVHLRGIWDIGDADPSNFVPLLGVI